jgi:hypothetical protein
MYGNLFVTILDGVIYGNYVQVMRTIKVGVPKKVVPTRISANMSVSNKSIVYIKLSMTSPNVLLTYYTCNTSN